MAKPVLRPDRFTVTWNPPIKTAPWPLMILWLANDKELVAVAMDTQLAWRMGVEALALGCDGPRVAFHGSIAARRKTRDIWPEAFEFASAAGNDPRDGVRLWLEEEGQRQEIALTRDFACQMGDALKTVAEEVFSYQQFGYPDFIEFPDGFKPPSPAQSIERSFSEDLAPDGRVH